jgi:4-amino-4-deoxy-L-arabinose transferase-like glycosyltransferase
VAICAICLFVGLSLLRTQFERYLLPLLLPLALGLAGATVWLQERVGATTPRRRMLGRVAVVALALIAVIPPAVGSYRVLRRQSGPSTLVQAKRHLIAAPGAGDLVYLMEAYTPLLPVDELARAARQPIYARLTEAQRRRLPRGPTFRVIELPMYMETPELSGFYYDILHCAAVDVVVTSSAVRARYENEPDRFGRQIRFYRDLEAYSRLTQVFAPNARTAGPELRVYRFDTESRRRLLRDRSFEIQFKGRMQEAHLRAFLERMASAAHGKGLQSIAEVYLEALARTAGRAQPRP